jgi:cytochrome c oxidase subunit 1
MATAAATQPRGFLRRPTGTTGWWSWVTTVDHKRIGIMYCATAFIFFLLGGIEALIIRAQLAQPEGNVVNADLYNQLFTMHGLTMIFLVVMPIGVGIMNYVVPLMIGARDVAFPRLNAFSYWVFLFGGLFLYSSFFFGGAPDGGWFGYAPLSTRLPGSGMSFYSLGLQILGVASLAGAVNFIVTIINMRAPGMTLMRMPVFVWMSLVTSFLLLFAMPVIAVALFQLMFDRLFEANFYLAANGGDPVLWQHLFWLFGHPEVYILILPAMGIVSEILPTFSRKPLFGYAAIVFAGAAIGFMGWGVWAHHMFAVGLGPVAQSAFALSTMFIAVPTGVKIFNWLGTLWGGSLRFKTPMLFAIGFVAMFVIGGLSGVTHAIVPHDLQQTDTYYIVAHFHYVLFGGAMFALIGAFYYWWPKVFGYTLKEGLGKLHFWLWFIGFNLTFGPFHMLGLQGMPRRIYHYPDGMGWNFWNMMSTIGAFTIAVSVLVFILNVVVSRRRKDIAGDDPWDGRTLEWTTPSPPPEYNFAEIPLVKDRDDFWRRKYVTTPEGVPAPVVAGGADADEHGHHGHIHMPSPSYFPVFAAAGLPMMGYGAVYENAFLLIVGGLIAMFGLFGWAFEPGTEE